MIEPWKIIKLKAKYGGIYMYEKNNRLYIQRAPLIKEVIQALEIKQALNLSIQEMFLELTKALIVVPEEQHNVPKDVVQHLAESMADDIPMTEQEIESQLLEYLENDVTPYHNAALELWSQVQGTTIDQFYEKPIKDMIQMYAFIRSMSEMQNVLQTQGGLQIPQNNTQAQKITPNFNPNPQQKTIDTKDIVGKSLDEVIKMLDGGV